MVKKKKKKIGNIPSFSHQHLLKLKIGQIFELIFFSHVCLVAIKLSHENKNDQIPNAEEMMCFNKTVHLFGRRLFFFLSFQ